jgi:DNA-binding response OmpR family regulator
MDVVLVRWPDERARRERLRDEQKPRLLLVDEEAPPPHTSDVYEDWVRLPAADADVRARVASLQARIAQLGPILPTIDTDGVLRFGGGWVSIPPVEARLIQTLIERFGTVVGREVLTRAGWPERQPGRNALDVHVLRLRRRIEPLGLAVRTVRSRGYLLEASSASGLAAEA